MLTDGKDIITGIFSKFSHLMYIFVSRNGCLGSCCNLYEIEIIIKLLFRKIL